MKGHTPLVVSAICAAALLSPERGAAATLQARNSESAATLAAARTVAVIGLTGEQMMDRLWANPNGARGEVKVKAVLTEWGQYEIVEDPRQADLVLIVIESQKNINLFKLANLVAELRVYRGGETITTSTPTLWSGDAAEGFKKLPATKVAEKFRDYVIRLIGS